MKKSYGMMVLLALMIQICLISNQGLSSESADDSQPEILLSRVLPVVNEELTLSVKADADKPALLSITLEGKQVVQEKIRSVNGKLTKKWIPTETGFYDVTFDFGDKALGKVSMNVPVVWCELYFMSWPVLTPDKFKDYRYLSTFVIATEDDKEALQFWQDRGVKVVKYIYLRMGVMFPGPDPNKTEEEFIDERVARWSKELRKGYDGIWIDEFGEYPRPELMKLVWMADKMLRKTREAFPDKYIFFLHT